MTYFGVVAASWLLARIPLRVAYAFAPAIGAAGYLLGVPARRNIQANLSVVLGQPPTHRLVRRTALRAFQNNVRNWIDTLRLDETTAPEVEERVAVIGWENITNGLKSGKGVILTGLHLGNLDLVGQLVAARGMPMTVPVEEMKLERLFHRTQELRRRLGIKVIPVRAAPRQMIADLKAGGIVGVITDRNLTETGVTVRFFGRETVVSKGPAWLARQSSAPVLLGYGVRTAGLRFQGFVEGPLTMQRSDSAEADIVANAQIIMAAAEKAIRRYPDQWVMFAPVWPRLK